jgi:hypothetical protein
MRILRSAGCGALEPTLRFFLFESRDRDDLAPSCVARDDRDVLARNSEHAGEKLDQRSVCPAALRRDGDAHPPPVAVAAHDLALPDSRGDQDGEPRHF